MPFNCDKHGYILHGTTCLNCEREREQITPKITPQTPRFSPHHLLPRYAFAGMDEIRADYVRMAAQWQAEWQRECEEVMARALTSGQTVTVRAQCTGSYPFMIIRVET